MKKIVYLALFIVLGILLSFIAHALIEKYTIILLVRKFDAFDNGLTWGAWQSIHTIGSYALSIGGILLGYFQGIHWWRVVYVEKRISSKQRSWHRPLE